MLIIGVAGGTGSGKTTVVRKIVKAFPQGEVGVLSQDSYYRDNSHIPFEERSNLNFDHPKAVEFELLIDHLDNLKVGNSIEEPAYSYVTCERQAETKTIFPTQVIIVEGILILGSAELRKRLDIKVYVDADADDRLIRVIRRDIVERGRSVDDVMQRYGDTVKPSHVEFIEPTKRFADLIVPQGGNNNVAIDILTNFIKKKLR